MPGRRGKKETPQVVRRRFFLLPAAFVFLFDQLTKILAKNFLITGTSRPVLPPAFQLTLIQNQGIAFGLFQDGEKILLLLISSSICVLFALGFFSASERLRVQWGIGLILGGALGNWLDRIRLGAVTDFLDFRIWSVFNFADTAISVGVGLFVLDMLKKNAP